MKKNENAKILFKPCAGRILLLCMLTLLQSLLQVGVAFLSRFVIDAALGKTGQLMLYSGLLAADILALVGMHTLLAWFAGSTMDTMAARLRSRLLRSAAYSRDVRLQQFHSGQLLSRSMEDVSTVCDGAVSALPGLVGQISGLVSAFIAVLLISKPVALTMLLAAVAIILLTGLLRPVLKKHHRQVRKADEQVLSAIQEDLQQLELLQSLQAQEEALNRFDAVQNVSLTTRRKRRVWSVSIGSLMNVGMLIGSGALLLWGAVQVAAGAITYGALTSMLQLFSLFRGPVLGISGLWTRLAGVEVAAERLTELMAIPQTPEQVSGIVPKAIVFDQVTFCYPGESQPVLQAFSGEFPLERWACLTGVSGRGKTTLFKLMLALYTPDSGRVFIRTETGEIPCTEATRHLFAYVPQDYALFSGTVVENMQLVSDPDPEALRSALSVAQADFIYDMPAGLNTQVRENNTGLSKGQIQRLAIARAILMDRPVLLLDECTSALDAQTEAAVLRGLHGLGKQAVLVTHRPDTLEGLSDLRKISMEE
ncbi:MAG: ABC transporter ATP-binding protein [Oscillospiraceae bacterium]|nr:ABC transporter ATP-binding protein [Oscillospiraceae bacterium]